LYPISPDFSSFSCGKPAAGPRCRRDAFASAPPGPSSSPALKPPQGSTALPALSANAPPQRATPTGAQAAAPRSAATGSPVLLRTIKKINRVRALKNQLIQSEISMTFVLFPLAAVFIGSA